MPYLNSLSTSATLALLILVGWIGGKLKIVDEISTERLSALIVKIGQPFLIINGLIKLEFTPENLKIGLTIFGLGLAMHVVIAAFAYLICKPIKNLDERKISEFSTTFGNCGFFGFPILESLYGSEGLFYGSFFLMSFHLFIWTWGVVIFARHRSDIKITPRKIFLNFGTLPCLIGFLIFISGVKLPQPLYSLTSYLAGLCTPIAIIISGANLSRRSLVALLKNPRIYFTNAMKLLIIPALVTVTLWLIGAPAYIIVFGATMAAMPCASMVTMFGELYRVSPGYAAELVGSSTLFCSLTIPVILLLAEYLSTHPII